MGYASGMKTTLDVSDNLLARAKELARRERVTLRSLAEEGLEHVLAERESAPPCKVDPVTFKGEGLSAEFRGASWQMIRDAAYEGRGS